MSGPSEEQMAVLGLTEEDFASDPVEVWPENMRSYQVFDALGGQWRFRPGGMGPAIPVALDHVSIPATLELLGIPRADWPQLFEDIRTMESAALQSMRD